MPKAAGKRPSPRHKSLNKRVEREPGPHESLEARVRERTADLTETIERLRREIAERKRAEEERDELLSVAAHELKTPLTSLRGFSQLLLQQMEASAPADLARLHDALVAIDRQSEKLARLVGQLLDLSHLQTGRLLLERQVTDLVPLLGDALEAARASTTRHTFSFTGPSSALAFVDPLRLKQVLASLLESAIKHSPDGGAIDVAMAVGDQDVQIVVTDQGLDVAPEDRERIFDRFHQAPEERRAAGMGLGLYVSRQIVELHGGVLKAEHLRQGGTWILLRLPLGLPQAAAGNA